ncbi:two-component system sensor histidine kinase NtrB [Sporosalibacterium faouarense]|uniref:two-component system sensor histidine kinase NtrB n=1 Tax=Sporosalibacterium faouarense TaxID=516123 RepID=UPI00192B528D|nr:ATP-binding protein [Sporosalibacterium faouarense]
MKKSRINIYDKEFWLITFFIIIITILHYTKFMMRWEFHIFYRRLYYIPIILAAFKYKLRGGLGFSLFIAILYAPHLILLKEGFNISSLNQYFEIILFISIGVITGKLVELDVNKQKLLEKKILEMTKLQNYTKNIVDSIAASVISLDLDFNITSVNKEGQQLLNITKQFEENKNIENIVKNKKVLEILKQVKVQKAAIRDIRLDIDIDNEKIYLVMSVFPLYDILDRVRGLVLVIENKSKEKNLEAQAIRADRLATIGELASGVAHEIRNPMGIIKTTSQVLINETEDMELKEGLEIIEHEVNRANKVIENLLNFAKPQESLMENIDISDLIRNVIVIIEKYARDHSVVIFNQIENGVIVFGDKEKLKQVFINIIFNAVQAIKENGQIKICSIIEDKWVKISFVDNGCGIRKENLKKIFNPFFTTKEDGIGLGMSIVNRIIQDHLGYINVDSEHKIGTTINIYLPMKKDKGDE